MIGPLLAQVVGTAAASGRQAIRSLAIKLVLALVASVLLIAGFAFVLVAIYHALTPVELTPTEAAGVIALSLLVLGGLVLLLALKGRFRPNLPPPAAAAGGKPDFQSAELNAIDALGRLNKALSDIGKGRAGTTPFLGLLGVAALVGFLSGRKR